MLRLLIPLLLAAPAAVARECPPPPDIGEETTEVLDQIQAAPSEAAARPLTGELWALWTKAPDARAQEMLDRGLARRESYDFAGAKAAFDELVAYCPDYAEGYNQRAFVAYLRRDYGAALADLDRALARRPQHVAAMAGKALTLMGLGRVQASQGVLREALKLNPWLPERSLLIEKPGEEL